MPGPEYQDVELPFIQQLQGMGWAYIEGALDDPAATGRDSFADVIQTAVLREQLHRINLRDGQPWLDEERLSQAVNALVRTPAARLMEANQAATELLLLGISVEGLPGWDGGRNQTLHYIDWATPENNRFTVINQYKVKCPPGHDGAKGHIIPDLVLLVNGIPLVVAECKSRTLPEGIADAVDQLRRYTNQRIAAGEVEQNEGAPVLFHTNQLLVVTNFDDARIGTIGAEFDHFLHWKTVEPRTEAEVAQLLGRETLSSQERLIAGLFDKANLLDIVRHYTLFPILNGRTIKLVCRYQQFRAVTKAIARLKTGQTRLEDGEHDRRGGLIWHTQGSGKSLTMVFLVRKMRTDPLLRRFKVVVITDRTQLQDQLSKTADLIGGDTVEIARNTEAVKALVKRPGPGLVFATIQKYREHDPDAPQMWVQEGEDEGEGENAKAPRPPKISKPFGVLNESADILVMVDEAHRTQAGDLHANLLQALPNCARIGFTGTPILMGAKKRTQEIFGKEIDRYTIKEAEADGATVPIFYEGRTAAAAVSLVRESEVNGYWQPVSLDDKFLDLFIDRTADELEAIKQKYATKGQIQEAPRLIEEKAVDMLRHYVTHILPNGYKAQVVAYSRRAAVRYHEYLERARDQLLAEARALPPQEQEMDDETLMLAPAWKQAAVQAWRQRRLLERIEFAVVISSGNNDDSAWANWSDAQVVKSNVDNFTKPYTHKDPQKAHPLGFLIVKSMLLTGFDAPIEGVMYLDRPIREAELLQAIARVNRTGFGKRHGIVVDYYGVANHLKDALEAYSAEDVEGALQSVEDTLPLLRDRHLRAVNVLRSCSVEGLSEAEDAVRALMDERVRAEFTVKLKQFMQTLDEVLPRPEGLEFTADAKRLAYIYAVARNRYKDTPTLGKDVGAKVRKLIDDYVISLGIDPKIPPIQLTDKDFEKHIRRQSNDRAKASEMEHAIRSHIRKHLDEDPVKYGKLSERLKQLVAQLDGQWEQQIEAFSALVREMQPGQPVDGEGLPDLPTQYLPFLRLLIQAKLGDDEKPDTETAVALADTTVELVEVMIRELRIPDFWKPSHLPDQERLKGRIFEELFNCRMLPMEKIDATVDRLMELARANHVKLLKS